MRENEEGHASHYFCRRFFQNFNFIVEMVSHFFVRPLPVVLRSSWPFVAGKRDECLSPRATRQQTYIGLQHTGRFTCQPTNSHFPNPSLSADRNMFRKPKRKVKDALRKSDDTETAAMKNDDEETSELLLQARKRGKNNASAMGASTSAGKHQQDAVMHTYEAKDVASRDLVTSTAEHHPENDNTKSETPTPVTDGIFRGDRERNKFHAGPIRAAAHVRVTARFDYQPDICKDYKETGFCGFGDTCIYLHDRGDTVSGWQLEQQWEEQQKKKKEQQEREMNDFATGKMASKEDGTLVASADDGIPFACHLCRGHFRNPVVTNCMHYFCESCIMSHVRTVSESCPVCGKDTGSVFNLPAKLIAKKRKVLGTARAKEEDSWEEYALSFKAGAAI
jgi:RING finger protein 113A